MGTTVMLREKLLSGYKNTGLLFLSLSPLSEIIHIARTMAYHNNGKVVDPLDNADEETCICLTHLNCNMISVKD